MKKIHKNVKILLNLGIQKVFKKIEENFKKKIDPIKTNEHKNLLILKHQNTNVLINLQKRDICVEK